MRITLPQSTLHHALTQIAPLAGGGTLPILQQVRLAASWGEICLCTSNEESHLQYRLAATVEDPGAVLLPPKLLTELVGNLPTDLLTLETPAPHQPAKAALHCKQARVLLNLSAHDPAEYPHIPVLGEDGLTELFVMDSELLKEVISQVVFVAREDSSRPALGGVRVELDQGKATFVAADAFRVVTRSIVVPPQQSRTLLIPATSLKILSRLLPAVGAVQLALQADKSILFHTDQMDFSTRLMHDRFPAYQGAIPAASETQAELPIASLVAALRFMAPFARAEGHKVQVRVQAQTDEVPATVLVRASAADLGENEMPIPATVSGPSLELLLNQEWLSELLGALPGLRVTLGFSSAQRPVILRPLAPIEALAVLMPMHQPPEVVASSARETPVSTQ